MTGAHASGPRNLIELIIVDHAIQMRESVYSPTSVDIERVCEEYDFPHDYVVKMIGDCDPTINTILFDVQLFREHLCSIGY